MSTDPGEATLIGAPSGSASRESEGSPSRRTPFYSMKWIWPWLLAALGGGLVGLTFPPYDHAGIVWFALTPLIAALWFSPTEGQWRPIRLFGLGYVFGLAFFWTTFFWITSVTSLGWFVLAFYLGLYPAVWGLFLGVACRPADARGSQPIESSEWLKSSVNLRLALRGAAGWVAVEWLRGTLLTGFGWDSLGVSLWKNAVMIQIADITGEAGVSFLIVLVNLILVMTVRRMMLEASRPRLLRPHFDFTLTMALVGVVFCYGIHRINEYPKKGLYRLSVAAAQGNIPQNFDPDPAFEQHILEVYNRLSAIAAAKHPSLLIWPEAAIPRPLLNDDEMKQDAADILAKLHSDFLLGSVNFFLGKAYNSAVLLDPAGHPQVYNKIHLVPFGEYVPFRHTFPLFAWIVGQEIPSDFDAGTEPVVMTLSRSHPVRVGTLICFEDTLGDLTRQFAQKGAEMLVTLTNDGWFGHSAGSYQHLANAVFRCAETKLPLVRCANTGVTCTVDPFGQVAKTFESPHGNTFIEGVMFADVPVLPVPPQTFYTRYGDLFALACVAGALLSLRTLLFTARRPRKEI